MNKVAVRQSDQALAIRGMTEKEHASILGTIEAGRSEHTRRMRRRHLETFAEFLQSKGAAIEDVTAGNVETWLVRFIVWLADEPILLRDGQVKTDSAGKPVARKASGIITTLYTIIGELNRQGYGVQVKHSEALRDAIQGIKAKKGAPARKARAFMVADLKRVFSAMEDENLRVKRDRLVLALGLAGGFRRAELVGVDAEHVTFTAQGVEVFIPKSKNKMQYSKIIRRGRNAETCPVTLLRDYMDSSGITSGPMLRPIDRNDIPRDSRMTPQSVSLILKKRLQAAGFGSQDVARYSAHSVRRGLITEARNAGADPFAIMATTGHKSVQTVQGYFDEEEMRKNAVSGRIGL